MWKHKTHPTFALTSIVFAIAPVSGVRLQVLLTRLSRDEDEPSGFSNFAAIAEKIAHFGKNMWRGAERMLILWTAPLPIHVQVLLYKYTFIMEFKK